MKGYLQNKMKGYLPKSLMFFYNHGMIRKIFNTQEYLHILGDMIMENCLYGKKTICTFDLKDESGLYYENKVLDWKQAAANRLLTCVECGAKLQEKNTSVEETALSDLNPVILEKCRRMIEGGNAHLVSKKYYDAIIGSRKLS
jgi:hypothetical protein